MNVKLNMKILLRIFYSVVEGDLLISSAAAAEEEIL